MEGYIEAPEIAKIAALEETDKKSFKDMCEWIQQETKGEINSGLVYNQIIRKASETFPEIRGIIEVLGFERIKNLKYKFKEI